MRIFDSLGYVNRLKEVGVSEKEAVIHAEALVRVVQTLDDRDRQRELAYKQQQQGQTN